jgi:hypothetical protein
VSSSFASGKIANGICDRCGFQYKLNTLKRIVKNRSTVNILVCPQCWEPDHPQNHLGELPVYDPQALRDPRPQGSDAGPLPNPAFYSFADVSNSSVISSAELVSTETIGSLTAFPALPTDFTSAGVSMTADGTKGLAWPSSLLIDNILHLTGFTMHYEVETEAFGYTKTGLAAAGDTMGLLFHETASKQLGFFRLQGLSNWSDRTGTVPVMTNSFNDYGIPTELTHYDYDFSVTKLQVGYRMDVYINRTLWYTSTNTSLPDFTDVSLVLAGGSGTSNPVGRIRNAMLIRGPVNSSTGILSIPCITVGDSNLYASAYQSTDARSSNNPLITGVLAASDGGSTSFGPSNSAVGISINQGNIFLNSALHDSGVSAQYQFSNKINNLSLPGGSISPGGGGTLESLVNMALALSPKPEYWFCQMGGNDVGLFTAIPSVNNGYPILSDWVTYIVDLYLAQIDRMLLASTTAKVFIASPCRWYTATDWADASTYEETKVTEVSSLVAEMESRIPNHFPGRVLFVNQYTNWISLYHAMPNATSFSNVHFNPEGNRVQAQNFASILPNLRQT